MVANCGSMETVKSDTILGQPILAVGYNQLAISNIQSLEVILLRNEYEETLNHSQQFILLTMQWELDTLLQLSNSSREL